MANQIKAGVTLFEAITGKVSNKSLNQIKLATQTKKPVQTINPTPQAPAAQVSNLTQTSKVTVPTAKVETPKVETPAAVPRSVSEIADSSKNSPLSITSGVQTKGARLSDDAADLSKSKLTQTSAPPVKSSGGNFGKYAVGAGIGALGLGLFDTIASTLNGAEEEPLNPYPQYPLNPYLPYNPYQPTPSYVINPETGELIPYPYYAGSEGAQTAYLTGDGYGDNGGGGTVIDGTLEALTQYAPYLIGILAVIIIISLLAGKGGKGKSKGKSKGKGKGKGNKKKGGNQK